MNRTKLNLELARGPSVPGAGQALEIDLLAQKVRDQIAREFPALHERQPRLIGLAINEAAALCWRAGYPQLLFPTLAMELVRNVNEWQTRQEALWRRDARVALAA